MRRLADRRVLIAVLPAILALIIAVVALFGGAGGDGSPSPSVLALAVAVAGCVALVARDRFPVPVLLVVVAARAVVVGGDGNEFALAPALVVALYAVARAGERRRALAIAALAAVTMALVTAVAEQDEPFLSELVGEMAIGAVPIAVADAARARDERLRSLIETEAAARVQAERLRIARDLHDVVAHGLSTIAVQSGVASHLLDSDPDQARESLDVINATGKRSLEELRTMVGVLRSTEAAPLRPAPTDPDDLSALLDGAGHSGVTVTSQVDGRFPPDVAEAAVVAVHRIVQEALTNVARHAPGRPASVEVRHLADRVEIVVTNELVDDGAPVVGDPAADPTGVGILGMAERAASLGGTLSAGPGPDGRFVVRATVPYHGPVGGTVPPGAGDGRGTSG